MTTKFYDLKTFTSRKSLGYLLKATHSLVRAGGERIFAGHDVGFVQWIVMLKLSEGEAITAGALCLAMHHDNGAMTRVLDDLEVHGYVERERSQQDRRVVNVKLTPAGLAKLDELTPLVVQSLNEALDVAGFTKSEFNELSRLLTKLLTALQTVDEVGSGAAGEEE